MALCTWAHRTGWSVCAADGSPCHRQQRWVAGDHIPSDEFNSKSTNGKIVFALRKHRDLAQVLPQFLLGFLSPSVTCIPFPLPGSVFCPLHPQFILNAVGLTSHRRLKRDTYARPLLPLGTSVGLGKSSPPCPPVFSALLPSCLCPGIWHPTSLTKLVLSSSSGCLNSSPAYESLQQLCSFWELRPVLVCLSLVSPIFFLVFGSAWVCVWFSAYNGQEANIW